jgi:phospholipase C
MGQLASFGPALHLSRCQLPIKKAIAENFAVFNHMHGSVPSFSTPNHLFWAFGTSCGTP